MTDMGLGILELFAEAQHAMLARRIKMPLRLWRQHYPGAVKRPLAKPRSQDPIDGTCAYCERMATELVVEHSLCSSHAAMRRSWFRGNNHGY